MSKSLKCVDKFIADTASGKSANLDVIFTDHVNKEWSRYENCWTNGHRTYNVAGTQSAKTRHMMAKAKKMLDENFDCIVVLSPNNVDALIQTYERYANDEDRRFAPYQNGKSIGRLKVQLYHNPDDIPSFMRDANILFAMASGRRLDAVLQFLTRRLTHKDYDNYPKINKIALIHDEAEEFSDAVNGIGDYETAITDEALTHFKNYCQNQGIFVAVDEYSATIHSKMWTHAQVEDVTGNQVFELPLSPYYKGIEKNTLDFRDILVDENPNIFNDRDGYDKSISYKATQNLPIIANELDRWINDKTYGYPAHKTPMIATIVSGIRKDSQSHMAELLKPALENLGYNVGIWDSNYKVCSAIRPSDEIIIIVYNGNTSKNDDISDKLQAIADYYNSKKLPNPKSILVVANKKANKAVTVEVPRECHNPNSIYFGYYVSATMLQSRNKSKNIEAEMQFLRCTGIRPDLKQHSVWVTPFLKNELINHYNAMKDLRSKMLSEPNKNAGSWLNTEFNGERGKKIGKGKNAKYTSGRGHFSNRDVVTNKDRNDKNYIHRDMIINMPQHLIDLADKLGYTNRKVRVAFAKHAKSQGFKSAAKKVDGVRTVKYKKYTNLLGATSPIRRGAEISGESCESQTIFTVIQGNKLYCYNKAGGFTNGARGRQLVLKNYIQYDLVLDSNGYVSFPSSTKYSKNDTYKPVV